MRPVMVIRPMTAPEPVPRIGSRTVPAQAAPQRRERRITYTVRKGDTLYSIARKFGVPVERIATANGIDLRRPIIKPGMALTIPLARKITLPGRLYIVRPGDCLYRLARKWGLDPLVLAEANLLPESARLKAGQRLVVPPKFEIWFDGERLRTKDVPPFVRAGIAFAPFRDLWEHTGGLVLWNHKRKEARALRPGRVVILQIGNPKALVNDEKVEMEVPPFIRRGRTIVPLSFVERAMDVNIEIDTVTGKITITTRR